MQISNSCIGFFLIIHYFDTCPTHAEILSRQSGNVSESTEEKVTEPDSSDEDDDRASFQPLDPAARYSSWKVKRIEMKSLSIAIMVLRHLFKRLEVEGRG